MSARIIGVCMVSAVMCLILKEARRPEAALILALSASIFVLLELINPIRTVIGEISELSASAGLDGTVFETVMKITATAYITQNGASLLRDCGEGALSEKVELGGKIIILASALPSVKALFEVIVGLL